MTGSHALRGQRNGARRRRLPFPKHLPGNGLSPSGAPLFTHAASPFEVGQFDGSAFDELSGTRVLVSNLARVSDSAMRITLTIEDDVLAVPRASAKQKGISLGEAFSELARRGFECTSPAEARSAGSVFAVPADAAPFTNRDVYRSLEDWP